MLISQTSPGVPSHGQLLCGDTCIRQVVSPAAICRCPRDVPSFRHLLAMASLGSPSSPMPATGIHNMNLQSACQDCNPVIKPLFPYARLPQSAGGREGMRWCEHREQLEPPSSYLRAMHKLLHCKRSGSASASAHKGALHSEVDNTICLLYMCILGLEYGSMTPAGADSPNDLIAMPAATSTITTDGSPLDDCGSCGRPPGHVRAGGRAASTRQLR